MSLENPILYGIIHVGASNMSLNIVQYHSMDNYTIIEFAEREVTFGEELFHYRKLSFQTIEEMCRILKGYKDLMEAYGVKDYKVFGTAPIREAENRLLILDQIYIHTGMTVDVVDMPKEIYYKYFALYYNLTRQNITHIEDGLMFLDITSGGVGITVWKNGSMVFQENVHIGSIRVMESFKRNQRSSASFPRAVGEYLYSMLSGIKDELQQFKIKYLILSGEEARLISRIMGYEGEKDKPLAIPVDKFMDFVKSFNGVTATKLETHYNLPEHKANIVMPTIILYEEVIKMTGVQNLLVGQASFTNGVGLYYGAEKENHPFLYLLREQNVQLAEAIARRYHSDYEHCKQTERFGIQFFDALQDSGLTERFGYLYRITAILCDVGRYVNLRNHSEHAYHIIMSTDIFGLSEEEKEIVANAIFYHYKGRPNIKDSNIKPLSEIERLMVAKLVAILRLARALDMSRKQKIKRIEIHSKDDLLEVIAYAKDDISLEEWTFNEEVDYFRTVFGKNIKIIPRR